MFLKHSKKIKINNFDYKICINISYIRGLQLIVAENLKHTNHVTLLVENLYFKTQVSLISIKHDKTLKIIIICLWDL